MKAIKRALINKLLAVGQQYPEFNDVWHAFTKPQQDALKKIVVNMSVSKIKQTIQKCIEEGGSGHMLGCVEKEVCTVIGPVELKAVDRGGGLVRDGEGETLLDCTDVERIPGIDPVPAGDDEVEADESPLFDGDDFDEFKEAMDEEELERLKQPGGDNELGLICGIPRAAPPGKGHVTCGIPMFREQPSNAPFVLPLYINPKGQVGSNNASGVLTRAEAGGNFEEMMKAKISGHRRQEALLLMKRFLDAAPVDSPSRIKGIVKSDVQVPLPQDLGPGLPNFGAVPPQTPGFGTFL